VTSVCSYTKADSMRKEPERLVLAKHHCGGYEPPAVRQFDRASHTPVFVLIAIATTLAYIQSFQGAWISDDVDLIAGNTMIRSLAPTNLRAIATSFEAGINYIPLTYLSFAFDYQLWGPHPSGFHLTNLVLHVANALIVYFLLLRMQESWGIAFAGSLLWALHPVQVESVAWISERKNLLSTLFFLLAFHAYLRYSARPRARTYVLLTALYLAALVSKVNTIVLPALTLTYELVMQRRLRPRDFFATLPLLTCGAAIAWVNLHGNPSHGVAYHGGSLAVTLRTSSTTIPQYLQNVVAPFDLSSYYPIPLRASWLDPSVAMAVAVILTLVWLTCWLAWHHQPEAFWLAWFGITLSPMLNLVPFPALMNDRYLYLPLLGALVPLLRLAHRLLRRVGAVRAAPALTSVTALGLGLLTVARVPVFQNELNLWADMGLRTSYITADQPYGAPPRLEQKRLLTEALAQYPTRAALHNNLGGFAFEENRLAEAVSFLARAQALDPTDPVIALNLGRAYLLTGRLDDAIRSLELATALEPPSFFPHLNLARAYLNRNDLVRARAALTRAKAVKLDPYFWDAVERQLSRAEQRAP
jgi:hypothetical protein